LARGGYLLRDLRNRTTRWDGETVCRGCSGPQQAASADEKTTEKLAGDGGGYGYDGSGGGGGGE